MREYIRPARGKVPKSGVFWSAGRVLCRVGVCGESFVPGVVLVGVCWASFVPEMLLTGVGWASFVSGVVLVGVCWASYVSA